MSSRKSAQSSVLHDDGSLRITRWRFAPGAATGWHRHDHDYAVVPLMDGALAIADAAGATVIVSLRRGEPYGRRAGVEHDVINANDHDYAFLEIELKAGST
jgi:quercetin dioxygenase-like cupin family protein